MKRAFGWVVCAAALSGCASTSPVFDAQFGRSARTLAAQQVAEPQAPPARGPTGLEGAAAVEAVHRYYQSFAAPEKAAPMFTINSGGER